MPMKREKKKISNGRKLWKAARTKPYGGRKLENAYEGTETNINTAKRGGKARDSIGRGKSKRKRMHEPNEGRQNTDPAVTAPEEDQEGGKSGDAQRGSSRGM